MKRFSLVFAAAFLCINLVCALPGVARNVETRGTENRPKTVGKAAGAIVMPIYGRHGMELNRHYFEHNRGGYMLDSEAAAE